ncbi:hypothetical protein [Pantoea sp. BAV 3049]|uniref:hypothetical protein n=1 Tax=Pantoea sp. BAV 3049 TaxID=2654188 RepID=UPI00131B00D7|nr:hypothetical protein [Pantoea sp. BAV 3049]
MFNSDEDDTNHVMIGEAAINLIINREEISPGSLINQLQIMASNEENDDRLLKIWEARKWLLDFRKGNVSSAQGQHWLASLERQPDVRSKEADIRPGRAGNAREKE